MGLRLGDAGPDSGEAPSALDGASLDELPEGVIGSTVTYAYDADGNRTSKAVSGGLVFYLRQLAFDANPKAGYPGPWRGHGDAGVIEHLEDVFGMPSDDLPRMWRALAGGVYRNAPCPCGRRVRYRKCHRARVLAYRARITQMALDRIVAGLRRSSGLRLPNSARGRRPVRRRDSGGATNAQPRDQPKRPWAMR
jgi:hypothetical protein